MAFDNPMFGDPKGPWIKTFAWKPCFTGDGGVVWMRRVWRRHIQKHDYLPGGPDWWWQYRRFEPANTEAVCAGSGEGLGG